MPYSPGRPANQPGGGPQGPPGESDPVRGPMRDLQPLPGRRVKVTVCSPDDVARPHHRKADAAGAARRAMAVALKNGDFVQAHGARSGDGLAQIQGGAGRRVALAPMMRLRDVHIVGAAQCLGRRAANSLNDRDADAGIGCDQHGNRFCRPLEFCLRRRVEPGGADQQGHRRCGARPRMQRNRAAHAEIERHRAPFRASPQIRA